MFKQEKADWIPFVSELKDELWKHGDRSTYVIELDHTKMLKLTPPNITNQIEFEHNMTVFVELKCHFAICNSAEIEAVDINEKNFARTLFKLLHSEWHPGDFSAAAAKIDELKLAYNSFDGNPIRYFQRVRAIVLWLTRAQHKPNTVEVCKACVDNIYAFANRKKATSADKMWSTWMAAFEREFKRYNLEILAKDMNEQYDAYLRI